MIRIRLPREEIVINPINDVDLAAPPEDEATQTPIEAYRFLAPAVAVMLEDGFATLVVETGRPQERPEAQRLLKRARIVVTSSTDAQPYDVRGLANPWCQKLIAETVARLALPDAPLSMLFITGASGGGSESSFVQAGMLPALEKHSAALNGKWAAFRSSRNPLAALADKLWPQLGLPAFEAQPASPADFGISCDLTSLRINHDQGR